MWGEALEVAGAGILAVFVVLGLLAGVLGVASQFFSRINAGKKA